VLYSLDDLVPITPEGGRFFVAPGARVLGKVRLGEDVGVWFGATLRGDTEWITIGARSNVQDNAVLHTDPGCPLDVGADCTIGHGAILHGCQIEDGVLIGMGATVLNKARIGRGSLVGANALVTEGKEFPPFSLILGSPARRARGLEDHEAADLLRSAAGYVARAERFRRGLKALG
jgi:carbonic anhydrase/acetyltransferase-like protein (isoleucine patch superfamily)